MFFLQQVKLCKRHGAAFLLEAALASFLMMAVAGGVVVVNSAQFSNLEASRVSNQAQQLAAASSNEINATSYANIPAKAASRAAVAGTNFEREIIVGSEVDLGSGNMQRTVTVNIYKPGEATPRYSVNSFPTVLGNGYVSKTGDMMSGPLSIYVDGAAHTIQRVTATAASFMNWKNNAGTEIAWVGYGTSGSNTFSVANSIGNIEIAADNTTISGNGSTPVLKTKSPNAQLWFFNYTDGANYIQSVNSSGTGSADLYIGGYGNNATNIRMAGNLYVNGNAVIDSGNIGSQSVNYATNAGNADTLDNYHAADFLHKVPGTPTQNTITYSRVLDNGSYASGNLVLDSGGANYPTLGFHRPGYTGVALYHKGTGNDLLRLRANNGADYAVIHEGNIASQSVNYATNAGNADMLDGYHASSFSLSTHTHTNVIPLTMYSMAVTDLPSAYPDGISSMFVSSGQGWPSYGSVMTVKTYSGGGGTYQIYTPYSAVYGGKSNMVRYGDYSVNNGNSWTSWKTNVSMDDVGNASGMIPLSNGTLNSNLNADLLDGYHADAFAKLSGAAFTGGVTVNGSSVITTANIGSYNANSAAHLLINGATWNSNWTWSGQSGQPSWLWGSNDGVNMYVWNPANFNVNYANSASYLAPISGPGSYKLAYTADGQRTNAGEWGRVVMRYDGDGQTYGVRVDRADLANSATNATHAATADSATYATNAGNADTLDGLHATSFMRTDANTSTSGSIDVSGGSGTGYSTAPIEILSSVLPRVSFHRPGVVASQIGMDSAGAIRTYNNPGTGYETFKAGSIFSNDNPVVAAINGVISLLGSFGNTTLGALNSGFFHFITDLPNFYFNKPVYVAGDVYGGASYNRRLSYVDEIAGIKVNNAVYADSAGTANNASTLAGLYAGNAANNIPISNGVVNTNLNADMVDSKHAGNANGNIPINNGVVNANLNAEMVSGYSAAQLMGDAGHSFGTNGYQKLGSGLIIQWGTTDSGIAYFPIAFPNACIKAYISQGVSDTRARNEAVTGWTNTYLTFGAGGDGIYGHWLAIGY